MSRSKPAMPGKMESSQGVDDVGAVGPVGARSASTVSTVPPVPAAAAPPIQRWSARRKREVVLRLLRGESIAAVSRELGIEVYRLEAWRDKALAGLEAALRERDGDPLQSELDTAHQRIGELSMETELLREKIARMEGGRPTTRRRSRR